MEVILLKEVEKLGKKGETLTVRDGFGRNFLLPRGLALPATRENKARLEIENQSRARRELRKRSEAEKLAQRLSSFVLCLEVAVGEKEKLFGSVTREEVSEALARKGISLDKKQIHLSEPIRSLGKYTVHVVLPADVKAPLHLEIVKKS